MGHSVIRIGEVISTQYSGVRLEIIEITGPCNCPKFIDKISMKNPPNSEDHYHFVCSNRKNGRNYYFGGYRLDGTTVWPLNKLSCMYGRDGIVFHGAADGVSMFLF